MIYEQVGHLSHVHGVGIVADQQSNLGNGDAQAAHGENVFQATDIRIHVGPEPPVPGWREQAFAFVKSYGFGVYSGFGRQFTNEHEAAEELFVLTLHWFGCS